MYKNYFELREAPFTIAPDPRYLYMSERHREALAHLLYGFKYEGGFVLLTGEVGTGKTTVCRCLLDQIPTDTDVALILNPRLTVPELLASICNEFSIEVPKTNSVKELVDAINHFLLDCNKRGRQAVLILDEAQSLSCEVLDQIRLLTNLETNTRKLLQIIMLGQPELLEKLDRPEMRQLAQRITARYHLGPLSESEIKEYVHYRWTVAGGKGDFLSDRQLRRLYFLSKGIPRVINVICDRILLGAYSQDVKQISMAMLKTAAKEVLGERNPRKRIAPQKKSGLLWGTLGGSALILLILLGWQFIGGEFPSIPYFQAANHELPIVPLVSKPSPGQKTSEPVTAGSARKPPVFSSKMPSDPPPSQTQTGKLPTGPDKPAAVTALPKESLKQMTWNLNGRAAPTRRQAFDALFQKWSLNFPRSEPSACQFADNSGLKCLFRRGTLRDLSAFNRPAILEMSSDDGIRFSAAIVQLEPESITLVVDGQARQVSADQLAHHWSGRYITVWKPPPGYDRPIEAGTEGPTVAWLTDRLAEAAGNEGGSQSASSTDLAREIKKFQIKVGLKPDGIAGEQTIMQLNSRTGKGVPTLHDPVP